VRGFKVSPDPKLVEKPEDIVGLYLAPPWLNMVERLFRDITTEGLRRPVFTSVPELVSAIDEYIADRNNDPKAFIWTKTAGDILQKVIRANSRLSSKQNATLR